MSSTTNWYKLNRSLHRDVGYFCVGLILIFSVSGIAVNHKDDWNPNYRVDVTHIDAAGTQWHEENDSELILQVLSHVEANVEVKASYWSAKDEFKVFLKNGNNLSVNLAISSITYERIEARHIFQAFNRLHLNETKESWVIFSDIFAGLLIFLALSGLFMVKGKYSPLGVKSLWIGLGILLPAGYIFL
ncbi:PepSY-associated TM helix domain-containing protein [Pseudoalteromonas neustonica]|uniref:PepSY-associated TM helix domain-containing protein n=1 Tax=Pseudoalteromonas neustonica TaxID=1840331 RepID=A0ABU9TZ48_9GAMM